MPAGYPTTYGRVSGVGYCPFWDVGAFVIDYARVVWTYALLGLLAAFGWVLGGPPRR